MPSARSFTTLAGLLVLALAQLSVSASVKDIKIRGYVTRIISPMQFEVDEYRVTAESSHALQLENGAPGTRYGLGDIRVGVEVEARGTLNERSGEMRARTIAVDLSQFKKQQQTAILSRPPQGLTRSGNSWTGTFSVDGQRIRVTPTTQFVFKSGNRAVTSLSEITTGMAITYEGARTIQDAAITATRVEVARNALEPGEKQLWDSLKVSTKPYDAARLKTGQLKIDKVGKFKTLPDDEVQNYASRIGRSLIPTYQRSMEARNANKIPFSFYVVRERTPNVFALPNGIVVIHSGVFDIVENEAQFAAIVGHEIAHAVQEHAWRQQGPGSDPLKLAKTAIASGYSRNLENQADRLALEYMINAGYDPREAPRVWKQMSDKLGDQSANFFWSNDGNSAARRSYLLNELRNNYASLDYATLRTGDLRFRSIVQKVHNAGGGLRPGTSTK